MWKPPDMSSNEETNMAATPSSAAKKRIRSDTPPNAKTAKNITFGDDSGIVIDSPVFSPTNKPDQKKKKVIGDITTVATTTGSEPVVIPDRGESNMAAPIDGKQTGELTLKHSGVRTSSVSIEGDGDIGEIGEVNAEPTEGEHPIPTPKGNRQVPKSWTEIEKEITSKPKRGRPRKRALSVDPTKQSVDIYSMLVDIQSELSTSKKDSKQMNMELVNNLGCTK